MKKTYYLLLMLLFSGITNTYTQTKKEQDIQSIKDMCGCFEVKFKYAETFAAEIDYEKAYDYKASALELAILLEDEKNKLSIQHLLVVYDTIIVKHWRQDWLYENTDFYTYNTGRNWKYEERSKKAVKGQWTQNVYQVDDSPRYSGSATWIHKDGKNYWENKSNAPLPRREFSKRNDYNLMVRGNRQEITTKGWVHEQDNDKIIRVKGEDDVLLVQEKGYNVYTKVEDERCEIAKQWWKENKDVWTTVRTKWASVLDQKSDLSLEAKVDDKPLFKYISTAENPSQEEINEIVEKFIIKADTVEAEVEVEKQ